AVVDSQQDTKPQVQDIHHFGPVLGKSCLVLWLFCWHIKTQHIHNTHLALLRSAEVLTSCSKFLLHAPRATEVLLQSRVCVLIRC
ncbi:hypothetical protein CPAR01_06281, partial [Colletotrichum paranaense]